MADQKLTDLTALPSDVAAGDLFYVVRSGTDYQANANQFGGAALLDVGTTAGTVAAGNDSRFTDARTPTAHAASHAAAGSDALTLSQSQITNLTTDLSGKEPTITAGTTAQYWRGDKSWQTLDATAVGLGSVTNNAQTQAAIVPNTAPSAGQILVGNAGGTAYAPVSASGDATLASTGALTLATVNSNVGSFGSATAAPAVTVNAKGLVTAVATNTITPAVGSITGLGTGVGTALAVNVGSAGAFVTNGGALGTPSSGTLTNCTFPTLNQNTTGSAASLSITGQTGLLTFTGITSTNRSKTVRDAADTILELGGSYTPTGTWTSMTLVTPALGTPASGTLTNCTGLPPAGLTTAAKTNVVGITIDGGGSAITTGVKGYIKVPFACTITGAQLLADQSGSIVIDVWKDTLANYPPTVADTITASAKPTLSSQTNSNDTTLTGWTTSITANDVIGFNVDSATTVTRVTLQLIVTRT